MQRSHRQEFIIKSCPTDDTEGLEYTLNTMCKEDTTGSSLSGPEIPGGGLSALLRNAEHPGYR